MNFINPLGRKAGDGVQPQACMCSEGYASERGTSDTCMHCGCSCDNSRHRDGNSKTAKNADRKSNV